MKKRTALAFFFVLAGILFSTYLLTNRNTPIVHADEQSDIAQQKAEKQKQLQAIIDQINAISSSQSSVSQKIKSLETEKSQFDSLITSIKSDLDRTQKLNAEQEKDLETLSQQYAVNHALYYLETQKNLGIMFFESRDLRDFLDRLVYYKMQTTLIETQQQYIVTKKTGLDNQKQQLESDQKEIQASLDSVNQKLAQLYIERDQLNSQLRQNSSARSLLVTDIGNLNKKEKDILSKKANATTPTGSGTTSSGSSGSTAPPSTSSGGTIVTKGIDISIDGTVFASTDAEVRLKAHSNGDLYVNRSCGGCTSQDLPYQGILIFNKDLRKTFTGAEGTKSINIINELPIEQYLRGLGEMPSYWGRPSYGGLEALKAQVVAARTYALKRMENYKGGGFDIYDTTDDQNYVGVSKVYSADGSYWDKAITDTPNNVVMRNGSPITTYYSSSSGGFSFSGWNTLSGASDRRSLDGAWQDYGLNVPGSSTSFWLPSGNTANSAGQMLIYANAALYTDPDRNGTMDITKRQHLTDGTNWKATLGANTVESIIGDLQSITQVYDSSGSTIQENTKVTVGVLYTGTKGTYQINGTTFKTIYNLISPGTNVLWSTLYDVVPKSGSWELWSRGFGHRVGMSQYGAYGRSRAGQDFKTILQAYYTGSDIVQYTVGRNIKVALTKAGQKESYIRSASEVDIYENGAVIKTVPPQTVIKIVYN